MSVTLSGPFSIEGFELHGSTVRLKYSLGPVDDPSHRFVETVNFDFALDDTPEVRSAIRSLLLIAGVSYYKSAAPTQIVTPSLSDAERSMMTAIYDEGLREFAYRNRMTVPVEVDLAERSDDPAIDGHGLSGGSVDGNGKSGRNASGSAASGVAGPNAERLATGDGALVPIGGGKDSALVADLVPDGILMAVNPKGAHERLAEHLDRKLVRVTRELDPQLRDLVAAGALNGHVPVTAINSAVAVIVAASMGLRDVLMGLERSASEPSLVVDGVEVNHQFSKSARAEQLLRDVFAPTGVRYLSLLRPMTELAIGYVVGSRGLASDIVSCNRVFTIWTENRSSRTQRPCGECAKCLFTALMLAPSLTTAEVREHFGRDLLNESAHLDPVRELWSAEKPFDCVGERHESAAAVAILARLPDWQTQIVPKTLETEALAVLAEIDASPEDYLRIGSVDELPEQYRGLISDLETGFVVDGPV